MFSFTETQKNWLRAFCGVAMAVTLGFLTAGLVNSLATWFSGSLLTPVFLITTGFCLAIAAANASLVGQMSFNAWAAASGWVSGIVSAILVSRVEAVPYSILLPLLLAAVVTAALTAILPRQEPAAGLYRLVMTMHVLSIVIGAWSAVDSLWHTWSHPWIIIMAASTFALWSRALGGACPLTLMESELRGTDKRSSEMGRKGFIRYYAEKWFHIEIEKGSDDKATHAFAVLLFTWWIMNYLANR